MGDTKKEVGKLIRQTRKEKGLTLKELGEKIGVAESTVANYEAGRQNLTLDTIDKIAEALGLQVSVLIK